MGRIRVLQIVTRLAVRGVPRHVLDMAGGLDSHRFEVEILAGRSEEGEGDLWDQARDMGLGLHRVNNLQRAVDPLADLRAYLFIARTVREGRYDIVHTHISKAGILGRLAAHRAGVPVVLHTYHGLVEEVGNASLKAGLFRLCERRAAEWSDVLVAVSRHVARQWRDLDVGKADQYRVVPSGIDTAHFASAGENLALEGAPRLLVVASLTQEKGIEVLLRAMLFVAPEFPDARLYLVGDGPLRPTLERLTGELGLETWVRFVGIQRDVRPFFAACDLALLPSLREGLGLAAIEAMAAGRAVVASSTGGIPEVVAEGETGLLVPPGDAQALAGAVISLLHNPERRRRMGAAGRQRALASFSLARAVSCLEALYEEFLSGRRISP
jgi:glycosyltransferase involved in cell wall biosynthesis